MRHSLGMSSLICVTSLAIGVGVGFLLSLNLDDEPRRTGMDGPDVEALRAEARALRGELAKARRRIAALEDTASRRPRAEETKSELPAPPKLTAAAPDTATAVRGEERAAALASRVQELEALLERAKRGELELTDEDVERRVADAQSRFGAALMAKDGPAALAVLRDLARLDERAFPALVGLWKQMREAKWLGLDWRQRRGWASAQLFHWALKTTELGVDDKTAMTFRRQALWLLPWYEQDDGKRAATIARALETFPPPAADAPRQRRRRGPPQDPYRGAVRQLARVDSPESSAVLGGLARRFDLPPDVRATAVRGLGRQSDAASLSFLETARQDADPEVQRAAELALRRRKPPVDGWLVTSVTPGSQAAQVGIEVGDIVTAYDGQTVLTNQDLNRAKAQARGREVSIKVHTAGGVKSYRLQGGKMIGINGEPVRRQD